MNNIFNSNVNYDLDEMYDLKGSTVGRFVPLEKRGKVSTLKDLDIEQSGRKLCIPPNLFEMLKKQIVVDSAFLAKHRIMDYSFLVGIKRVGEDNMVEIAQRIAKNNQLPENERKNTFASTAFNFSEGGIHGHNKDTGEDEYYYLGIIDILQKYNKRKKLEHFMRSISSNEEQISVVEPSFYASRFQTFLIDKVLAQDDSTDATQSDVEEKVLPLTEDELKSAITIQTMDPRIATMEKQRADDDSENSVSSFEEDS
eukprot:CAMPEP_0168508396 /NCGR_PEP_ID=MMETSP0405-20121227/96_1 /TAXON_ID=498012 /ORGANISM="Trichosphaerium sp, Strain Am-I-7 wt" /LENGTH=254 /DNA_ID=CAMNT_0008525537 /DNA_START=204 /DNA_END=968 /DNA_ORIENTATION=-